MAWNSFPLVALQLNSGCGGRTDRKGGRRQGQPSRPLRRFFIRTTLKRTRREGLPHPTFVAICDQVGKIDSDNIIKTFAERDGVEKLKDYPHPKGNKRTTSARLVYDTSTVEAVDNGAFVVEGFTGLDGRISGGLFWHIKGGRFVVAISVHGPARMKLEDREDKLKRIFHCGTIAHPFRAIKRYKSKVLV
jgi:hypothetical protein